MIINEFPLKYSLVDMEEVEAGVELKLEKKASLVFTDSDSEK